MRDASLTAERGGKQRKTPGLSTQNTDRFLSIRVHLRLSVAVISQSPVSMRRYG
jgi:hypothetical protein